MYRCWMLGAVVVGLLLVATPVWAQSSSSASGESVDQETLYEAGFTRMGQGNWRGAAGFFRRCARQPGPRTAFCEELAIQSDKIAAERLTEAPPSGRTELMVYSTAFGGWTGIALGVIGEFDEGILLAGGVGGLLGLGGAYLISSDNVIGVTQGEAALVTLGGNVGIWHGAAGLAFAPDDVFGDSGDLVLPLAAGYAGLGAALLAFSLEPSVGDVALTNSGALWGTFLSGMGLLVVNPKDIEETLTLGTLLLGTDIGLVSGALLAREYELSRTRILFMDLGGVLGTLLVGGLLAAVVPVDSFTPQLLGGSLGAGAVGGGALSLWLTRDLDEPEENAQIQFDAPTPFVVPHGHQRGEAGWAAGLHLVQGTFF